MEAAVVARPDEKWGETPCAFVTLKPDAEAVSEADIIAFCRANLAHYKAPKAVVFGPLAKDLDRENPEIRAARAGEGDRSRDRTAQLRGRRSGRAGDRRVERDRAASRGDPGAGRRQGGARRAPHRPARERRAKRSGNGGGTCLPVALDVTDAKSIAAALDAAEAELGPLSILVNNAGVVVSKPFFEHTEEDWDHVVDTNLKGAWMMARDFAHHLVGKKRGGRIVNIASVLSFRTIARVPSYLAAKAGLLHLNGAMAMELARYDILVNAIAPGYVVTDFNRDFLMSEAGLKLAGAGADEAGRAGRGSRRRAVVSVLARQRLCDRRLHLGRWRPRRCRDLKSGPADHQRSLARFLAEASGARRGRDWPHRAVAGRRDPGELGASTPSLTAAGCGRAASGAALRCRDRGAVEPRPDRGIRRAASGVRRGRDGAGAALRLRRYGGARQAVFRDAPGRRQRAGPADHARSGAGAGAAGARRAARPRAGADADDPPAARRPRFSAVDRPGRAHRRIPRLPRPPSQPAAGAGMGAALGSRRICPSRCRRCCATAISAPAITCSMAPKLTAILDWEFAGWGDPDEDIGWLCCKGWRFGRLDREAGGIAERAPFYRGYESESGRRLDPERVRFWEVMANLRWAVIAMQQSDRFLRRRRAQPVDRDHRAPRHRMRARAVDAARSRGRGGTRPMRDLPASRDLLALARELLLDELLPLLPPERERDAHLIATSMAIAARETAAREAWPAEIMALLNSFMARPIPHLLRRFAADLRNGAFETSPSREQAARAILWRLTIEKLREGNPHFLAANGFRSVAGKASRACRNLSGKRSRPSAAAKSSSSPTTTTAKTRATSSSPRCTRPRRRWRSSSAIPAASSARR